METKPKLQRHKFFDLFKVLWSLYEDVVEGMPAMLAHLYRYPAESAKKFAYRKDLACWHGLPAEIVLRWVQTFAKALVNTKVPPPLEYALTNVDGAQSTINAWRQDVFDHMATYGSLWGLIDAPASDVKIKTEAQRKAAGIYPYCVLYTPAHVVDWTETHSGSITMALVDTGTEVKQEGKEMTLYRRYMLNPTGATITEELVDEGNTIVQEGMNRVDLVMSDAQGKPMLPIFRAGIIASKKYKGYYRSPLDGIADKSKYLFNNDSQLVNLFAKAAFAFLVWPAGQRVKELGQNSLVEVDPGQIIPQYVSPDSTLFTQYFEMSSQLTRDIFVIAGMKPTQTQLFDNRKSGAAIAEERHDTRDKVTIIADAVARFERQMWDTLSAYLGQPELATLVVQQYPVAYDVYSLTDQLAELEAYAQRRNVSLYMERFEYFVRLKVRDKEMQDKIIEEERKSLSLRFGALSAPVISSLEMLLKNGVVNVAQIVRTVNPDFAQKTDAEALTFAQDNMKQYQADADEFGLAAAAVAPAKP